MLWLINKGQSNQIVSCNTHKTDGGVHQLWVEKPNGKTMKIVESKNAHEVAEVKDAIDFAIKIGKPSLELE